MSGKDFFALCIGVVLGIFVTYTLSHIIVTADTERSCMRRGWPSASVTWSFDKYCVKRINQTDSIVPLDSFKLTEMRMK